MGLTVYFIYPKTFESQAQVMTSNSEANSLGLSSFSSLPMNVISNQKVHKFFIYYQIKIFFSELSKQDIRINNQIISVKDYFLDLGKLRNDNNEIQKHAMYSFFK